MRVYRISKNGVGPYRSKDHNVDLTGHNNNPRTPAPIDDFASSRDKIVSDLGVQYVWDAYYGFRSLEAMFRWFTIDELSGLNDADYKISVWDAPTCKIGKSGQVLFVPKKSNRICDIKICNSLDNQKKHCRIMVKRASRLQGAKNGS